MIESISRHHRSCIVVYGLHTIVCACVCACVRVVCVCVCVCVCVHFRVQQDLHSVVRRVAQYIGVSRTEQELQEVSEMLKFDSMKDIQSLNCSDMDKNGLRITTESKFMRKGNVCSLQIFNLLF